MLSKGVWNKVVPREARRNRRYRRAILEADPCVRPLLMERCREDFLYWMNVFVMQYNPNTIGEGSLLAGPWISWPFQDVAALKILCCIEERRSLPIEKSREMGASWLCVLIILWLCLFHKRMAFLLISRNAESVDRPADPASLFWKIDFVLEHLPDWMKEGTERRKMGIYFRRTNSSTTGQASTGEAGVAGRYTAIFVDEFSKIKEDRQVLQNTASSSGCRIFNGTHEGLDTAFYAICQREDWEKLQMHWSEHPDKNKGMYRYDAIAGRVKPLDPHYVYPLDYKFIMDGSPLGGPFPGLRSPWYDHMCREIIDERGIATNLDINPAGSVTSFVNAVTIRDLVDAYCRAPLWEGVLEYDRDSGEPRKLTPVPGGPLKLWIVPTAEGLIPFGFYTAGNDLSEGTGATPSCLSIINADTGEKVLEYIDRHIKPEPFAVLVTALCRLFRTSTGTGAKLCWEMVGPGERFGRKVIEQGYGNIFYRENEGKAIYYREPSENPGWYPTAKSRTLLLGEYRAALYDRRCLNRSEAALREFCLFRYDQRGEVEYGGSDKDLSGAGVNHGDIVIADALAWKMASGHNREKKQEKKQEVPFLSVAWRTQYHEREKRRREAI